MLTAWATTACTLTTALDFVGPDKKPPQNNDAGRTARGDSGPDAAQVDGPAQWDGAIDGSVQDSTAPDGAASERTLDPRPDAAAPSTPTSTGVTAVPPDTTLLDASLPISPRDASEPDARVDDRAEDAAQFECVPAVPLLNEGYEGTLSQWSIVNWPATACQETGITTAIAVERDHSVRSRVQCAAVSDHLHFTSLQLAATEPQSTTDSPHVAVLSFAAWLSVGYDFSADKWLDLARFTMTCDGSDAPLALSLNRSSRHLVVNNSGNSPALSEPVSGAPAFPLTTWARVDVLVDPAAGSLAVWQDEVLVAQTAFQAENSAFCRLELGTMASKTHTDLVTFMDDVRLSRLKAPITDLARPPRVCLDD